MITTSRERRGVSHRARRALLCVLCAVSVIAQATPALGATPEQLEARQIAAGFRQTFGLRSDDTWIAFAQNHFEVSTEWGVPLSGPELAEMNRRGAVANGLD
jgi:hypothetical protein